MTTAALPRSIEALTPAFLTDALREGGVLPRGSVVAVASEPVGQGVGLLCQLARLSLTYDGAPAGVPATLIAKIPSGDEQTKGMANAFGFYAKEVRFYRELAARVSLPAPACWYSALEEASGDFVLLLEDLGAARLGDQLAGCTVEEAALLLRELAKVHAAWWNSPMLDEIDWVPDAGSPINKAGLTLYPLAWPAFVERFGAETPPELLAIGERLGQNVNAILDRFCAGPKTLCHGDYRADNFFFGARPGQPPLRVIDWQIAVRAVGTYDVGYFLTQSLDVPLRRAHELELLGLYHRTLREGGVQDYSFGDLISDYRWTALFCFAYPVMGGGLADLSNARGVALARAMMQRSAAAILDWQAGELLG
ncbi:MAG TPA: phosphotransferase [Dehalococcoidia bacterium]|nr:phosphotransferase [Dehalococcoidia bacterium]